MIVRGLTLHCAIRRLQKKSWRRCAKEGDGTARVIRHLPAERQHLLILKFVEHMSNAEIGEIMGRSEGAVKSLYHRTLLALRNDLEGVDLEGE